MILTKKDIQNASNDFDNYPDRCFNNHKEEGFRLGAKWAIKQVLKMLEDHPITCLDMGDWDGWGKSPSFDVEKFKRNFTDIF